MGLGFGSGLGAGAAAASLTDILKQRFVEQLQKQKLAEDMRQADMANQNQSRGLDIQQQNLLENQALRRQTQDSLDFQRQQQATDRADALKVRQSAEFRAGVPLRLKNSLVTPQEKVTFNQEGLGGLTSPAGADEHSADPHFHFAGTSAQEDVDAAAKAKADQEAAQRAFQHTENEANRANAVKVAGMRGAGAAGGATLSDDAITQGARSYLAGNGLPAMGMGGAAARIAMLNRAAEIDPQRNVALAKSSYTADSSSLKKLQMTADSLTAFKNAATANLGQFDSLLSKLPDSGSPLLNTPIRQWAKSGVGSEAVASAEAARRVALREISRVTSNPNLTGQLSDTARKEVDDLIPENATVGQIRHVMTVLQNDLDNVERETNAQLGTIKSRMKYAAGGDAPAPAAPPATAPATDPKAAAAALIKKYGGG